MPPHPATRVRGWTIVDASASQVARLVLRSREELHDIPLDHPCLATGWWAVERDGVALRRWTDGDAVLPLPATGGASMLEVRVADTVTYLTMAEMVRAA